jgi:hypothetical protein
MMSARRLPVLVVCAVAGLLASVMRMDGGVATRPLLAIAAGPDSCGDNDHVHRQGATAGTSAKVCQGSGPVFIGAADGQRVTVTGPTVTGPAQVNAVVAAGDGLMGY